MRRPLVAAAALAPALVAVLSTRTADAHAIPRLYASLAPSAAYDPINGCALTGGGFMLGLGVDPEVDALLLRGDLFAAFTRGPGPSLAFSTSILYRWVLRKSHDVVWTMALGGGAILALDDPELPWGTAGVRGELGVRLWGAFALTAFALAGPAAGRDVRVPWGTPIGLAIEVGAP